MYKACDHTDVIFEQDYKSDSDSSDGTSQNELKVNESLEIKRNENLFKLMKKFSTANDKKQINKDYCNDCCYEAFSDSGPCKMTPRLYVCAVCLYVGCFKFNQSCHIMSHSQWEKHYIFIDLVYGYIYCTECKDYQYNQVFEDLFKAHLTKSNSLAFGKFQEWEPSQKVLKFLKQFAEHSKSKPESQPDMFELFRLKSSSIIGLRGLLNLGNTCFMNCILQTFTHTPTLRDYFLSDKHVCLHNKNPIQTQSGRNRFQSFSKDYCLVCELVLLFQEFYSGKRSIHIPFNLLYHVWTAMKHLAGYEQQDAHEFFIAALNSLHKNCIENDKECISMNKKQSEFTNHNNCHCIIDKIFTGGLQSDVICSNCMYVSTKVDPFWDISLDLGNNLANETKSGESLKLEDCLIRFTLPEVLNTFNCSACNTTNDAKKQLTMKNLPTVCCFHLKRFEQSLKIHKKISTHISFPEILDMSPFMSNKINKMDGENVTMDRNPDSQKYFLFAVVNHHGTLESGHYTSFIRLTEDQWFDCDDHIIKKSTIEDVMKSEGYLLFYHKIWNEFTY